MSNFVSMKWRMILWGVVLITLAGVALEPVLLLFPDRYWDELQDALGTGVVAFILGVTLAPLIEEGLFRGLGTRLLAKWWESDLWAIFVSAVLFAFAHYPIWPQVPNAFVGGLVLGYTYRISRTLWVPIAIHAVNNLLAWLATELSGETLVDTREMIGNEFLYWLLWTMCTAAFVLGMVMLHNKLRRNALDEKHEHNDQPI